MNRTSIFAFLAAILVLLGSCSSPAIQYPVTIAIPISTCSSYRAVDEFHEILVRDSKHYLRDSHVEGTPEATVSIRLDSAQLHAYGMSPSRVRTMLDTAFAQQPPWQMRADSLEFTINGDSLETGLTLDAVGLLKLSPEKDGSFVHLRDVAAISSEALPHPIMVDGQACVVIRGNTIRTNEALQKWLSGLDEHLGLKFFIVYGEALPTP